jgi:hypothetical protein
MTDDATASSSAVVVGGGDLVTELNDYDVILGRGAGPSQFIGNLRLRNRVEARQEEYVSITTFKHKTKGRISKELVDQTHALGGRFVKPVESERRLGSGEVWYEEVADAKAIEKCKQALRDYRRKQGPSDGKDAGNNGDKEGGGKEVDKNNMLEQDFQNEGVVSRPVAFSASGCSSALRDSLTPLVPSMLFAGVGAPCVDGMRPVLFQSAAFALPQHTTTAQPMATNCNISHFNRNIQNQNGARILSDAYPSSENTSQGLSHDVYSSVNISAATFYGTCLANNALLLPQQTVASAEREEGVAETMVTPRPSASEEDFSALEEDSSEFLLTLLTSDISDRPKITEKQVELERAAMTDEEKTEALTDMFGRKCAASTPNSKRPKRDLDTNSIAFLVKQMRLELERIPEVRKRALMEAQTKCHADEFSDSRLERFLRCEGMNVNVRL